jgi:hypothetical protein
VTSSPQDLHAQSDCARTRSVARVAALAIAGVASFGAVGAEAQDIHCDSLPNPIHGSGGSAGTPLIKRVATKLAAANPPITVIYYDGGSACQAMTDLGATAATQPALAKNATYWKADGSSATCVYPAGSTVTADWGSMAQEPTTCQGVTALPPTVSDATGPISGFSIIVPNGSSEYAISAEAIYYIYGIGIGNGHDVAPWLVPGAVASRGSASAAGLLLAKAASIPASRSLTLQYTDVKTNGGAVAHVTTAAAAVQNPNAAIGFCSTETVTALNPPTVRTLAFKAQGQDYAYGPDSSATSPDKKNLREGRYFLWNPHHFFAVKSQLTAKPYLQQFIDIVTSKAELPAGSGTFLDLQIANGNVPQCAMHVTRSGDMGPLASFQPEHSCGCYYDYKTTGKTSCKACATTADCGSGFECNVGYCEVK